MGLKEKEMWNRMADHFQNIIEEDNGGHPERLVAFLEEKGALKPGIRIADIGCGAGKYAIRFAKMGCDLFLLDIAENMMAYTKQNLAAYPVSTETAVCDWAETDVIQEGWEKSVDLAFAAMSPAIVTKEALQKQCAIARKHCFISKFYKLDNLLVRSAAQHLGLEVPPYSGEDFWKKLTQWLLEDGYLPEIRFDSYGWVNEYSVEQALDAVMRSDLGSRIAEKNLQQELQQYLQSIVGADGIIQENVNAKVFMLFWDVNVRL